MEPHLIIQFWMVAMLFVITPGADWAYAIASGLKQRSPLPGVLGMLAGHLIATLIVAAGVGALLVQVPVAMTLLTLLGAAYLLWLGIGMLRSLEDSEPHPEELNAASDFDGADGDPPLGDVSSGVGLVQRVEAPRVRQLVKGIGVSLLNPKVFLLFLALLPQFVDTAGALPLPMQMSLLGLLHVASCGVVYLLVGYGARRVLGTRPRAARIVTRLSGAAMIVIAAVLLLEKLLG